MRKLLVTLVVVVALFVAADFGLRLWAQSWFAGQIRTGLKLQEDPKLSLGGFPFLVEMARGRLSSAGLEADGFTTGGLRIERFHLDLSSVRFSTSALLSRGTGTIRVDSGSGTATVTEDDLTAWLVFQGYHGKVTLAPGKASVQIVPFAGAPTVTATGPLSIRDGRLAFDPTTATAGGISFPVSQIGFSFPLRKPFEGFDYRSVKVGSGTATLGVVIRNARIEIVKQ
jgi:hypothetical protein